MGDGLSRGEPWIGGSPVRYDVHTINFELGPIPDEGRFLVDERPDPPTLYAVPKTRSPMVVAVRLDDLVVRRSLGLAGANIRVDALAVTGRRADATPVYGARTAHFDNICDDEVLPLDRMLVYLGPAVDYLDLAVWVSRDDGDGYALDDLLSAELSGDGVQQALTTLGGAVDGASHAAAAAALIGAGAIITNIAFRALRRIAGDSIGVYRRSRLAAEDFGVGRHPQEGSTQFPNFSLAYSIERMS